MDDPLVPIPLVVLTGFLGAGKTTRLNQWLSAPALADTLVIINEFGEVGLDHLLVEDAPGEVVLLAAGCLCCSLRGDLVATLEDLLRRRDNARMPFFRRVVLETTGLADPLPVLQSVLQHPYLAKRFDITGIVTLIDALAGLKTLETHPVARRQVSVADRLVLSKADIAPQGHLAPLRSAIAMLNPPAAAELEVPLDADTLFDQRFRPTEGRELDLQVAPAPSGNHADGVHSFAILSQGRISEGDLTVFREAMRVLHGPKILRAKGLVAMADDAERPMIIHQVQSFSHPPQRLERWPTRDHRTRLVFITDGNLQAEIERFWAALANRRP